MPPVPGPGEDAASRIAGVRAVIAEAARGAGRAPQDVRIVAVSKTLPPAAVVAAVDAGLVDVGENYVQEAARKRLAVDRPATWHLIGGLQRNKVAAAVRTFDWVHTLDSSRVALALDAAAGSAGRRIPVLIQVDAAGAAGQRGAAPEQVRELAEVICGLSALALQGLMTIAPAGGSADEIRSHFRQVRLLRDEVAKRLGIELPHLSMGMSGDFSLAVAEGATLVRLGRVLFGPREPRSWQEGA